MCKNKNAAQNIISLSCTTAVLRH